jgi:hypothetical protein
MLLSLVDAHAANLRSGRADEALQGSTLRAGKKLTRFLNKDSPVDQDTDGRTQRSGLEKL